MFWIGAAAGAFVCLVLICVALACVGWSAAKDRLKETDFIRDKKQEMERLFGYWEECNRANQEENEILRQILEKMPDKTY